MSADTIKQVFKIVGVQILMINTSILAPLITNLFSNQITGMLNIPSGDWVRVVTAFFVGSTFITLWGLPKLLQATDINHTARGERVDMSNISMSAIETTVAFSMMEICRSFFCGGLPKDIADLLPSIIIAILPLIEGIGVLGLVQAGHQITMQDFRKFMAHIHHDIEDQFRMQTEVRERDIVRMVLATPIGKMLKHDAKHIFVRNKMRMYAHEHNALGKDTQIVITDLGDEWVMSLEKRAG